MKPKFHLGSLSRKKMTRTMKMGLENMLSAAAATSGNWLEK
jgi:hypothetical protein